MKTREKQMLRSWPIIWPLFLFLMFRHHNASDWWKWFSISAFLLTVVIASGVGIIIGAKQLRKRIVKRRQSVSPISAFTLIELLVVIAIIGLLAALVAPSFHQFRKGDVIISASRQMLDDCARARQLAISGRTTVYMVFVNTNFWKDSQWPIFAATSPALASSVAVTQMYSAQLNGYAVYSLQTVGDQPGNHHPQELLHVRTLPAGSFFAPIKFSWPSYPSAPFLIPTNYPMYGFQKTTSIPFPTVDVMTNSVYMNALTVPGRSFPTIDYIAFNYLGQLTTGDGNLLPYDEYIPLSSGTIAPSMTASLPSFAEEPVGNSTNISYTLVHIDRLTGRARIERFE